ncbi:F-box domain-containing protein [Pandoravirus kuranda]|uniref:F-box domain-containing protein n=2 Tax=Pandoravirus TaxID=2060084 RepID=A0AA95J7Q4_9VIRU|nr:F-box domain containing protein [Pandoravirus neocaledonia]AVK76095.1 F-box domain containing protein [Pandoravirus neocaledonia]WBR14626.1 F-box domain-containing protein [Pandoravirus kuranda]
MLLLMPDEILLRILAAARPTVRWLLAARTTCQRFALLCNDDVLWKLAAVDALGQSAVAALRAPLHMALMRFVHTTKVHIVVSPYYGSSYFRAPRARERNAHPHPTHPLKAVATMRTLAMTICNIAMCPPHRAHVWASECDRAASCHSDKPAHPLRLIHAPAVSAARPSDRPWWASAFERSANETADRVQLSVCGLATALPVHAHDSRSLLYIPPCVLDETPSDLGLRSPSTWYNRDSGRPRFSLTHVKGCSCQPE